MGKSYLNMSNKNVVKYLAKVGVLAADLENGRSDFIQLTRRFLINFSLFFSSFLVGGRVL